MDKARIYELAKELNTTSKRLMEKLAEINIHVKNHMSLLEPHELDALYKHIGVIRHDDKKPEEEKKPAVEPAHAADRKKDGKDVKKDAKNAPRIIRKTEIVIDSRDETGVQEPLNNFSRKDGRSGRQNYKNDFVKTDSSTSGLRPGYVRDTKPDFKNKAAGQQKNTAKAQVTQQDDITAAKQNAKIEDVKKEEKLGTANTTNITDTIAKNNEADDTAKSNTENAVERVDMRSSIIVEKKETAGRTEAAPKHEAGDVKKAEESVPAEVRTGEANKAEENTRSEYKTQGQGSGEPVSGRPQGQYNNGPRGDRPQGQYNNGPRGDRPQGQYNNGPRGDRPQGQYNNGPRGDRPQGQ